ncbi:retinol dehydrogenase 13 isoform X1 [Rattus norvegicus]|uniref:retinol dehydrogenase 13 isoform X1 n=1 Tax=Rattus norvegicus TaxID=10116 RepID=UPI001917925F|nr:retinol dehydrogenase 13 isoform X1 [Rattus norvegicus]
MNRFLLPVSVVGTVIGGTVLLKDYVAGGACPSKATIPGRTVIVTGANTGIGKQTALELAKRGGNIILACRDREKCEAAAKDIRGETLNPRVRAEHLDLASLKSIREFAGKIIKEEERVDILVNNAAVMRCPHWTTKDGFEMQFGVNHLGTGVTVNALHPGVARTELGRHTGMHNSAFSGFMLGPFFWLLFKSPQLAAQPSTYLAVAEELESVSGKYFDGLREKAPSPEAEDEEVARRLWTESAHLVGLDMAHGSSGRGHSISR